MSNQNCTIRTLPVRDTLDIVGGRWKLVILYLLADGVPRRFGELQRLTSPITASMLSKELKELEMNRLVDRQVFATTPVTVEYRLSSYGRTLEPVIQTMHNWGERHRALMMGL